VDCAVRVGSLDDSSLAVRPIGRIALVNCASPAYVRERGMPSDVEDLAASHVAVGYASPTTGRELPWECADGERARTIEVPSRVVVNNAESYIACCLAGLGLIQVPRFDVQDLLASGELVEVMPDCRAASMEISIVYPHRRQRSRRLLAFLEWFEDLVRPHLE
jgi:DNA-binding transcriptional LysR family regulator